MEPTFLTAGQKEFTAMTITRKLVFALLCAVTVFGTAPAQNKRVGTSSGTQLLIPTGARDIAMGGSTMAASTGIGSIHWNPAGLGRMESGVEAMFSTMSYIADISVQYGAVAADFSGFGVVGLSIKSLDFGEIPLTTQEDPLGRGGRTFSPTFVIVGLSYAKALTDAISAGGTLKILSEQIERVSASGVAVDFGVQYHRVGGLPGLSLGVTVKNIGPRLQYDGPALYGSSRRTDGNRPEQKYKIEASENELPSTFEIGLSYAGRYSEELDWTVLGAFVNRNLGLDEFNVGGEVGYQLPSLRLFGRGGYNLVPQAEVDEDQIFGATFGLGILYDLGGTMLHVDYAYRDVRFFQANQVVTVTFIF